MQQLFTAPKYGDRRGAAYGLAGIVKGAGVGSLQQFGIMDKLSDGVQDKRNLNRRQGSLLAFETLSSALGRTFEPNVLKKLQYFVLYIMHVTYEIHTNLDPLKNI